LLLYHLLQTLCIFLLHLLIGLHLRQLILLQR
jgi:hypothetical protein